MITDEKTLIDDGGLKLDCSEALMGYCGDCGGRFSASEAQGGVCPICAVQLAKYHCTRCDGEFSAAPVSTEHACQSIEVFRRTGKIAFEEEVRRAQATREREEAEETARQRQIADLERRARDAESRSAELEASRIREIEEANRRAREAEERLRESELRVPIPPEPAPSRQKAGPWILALAALSGIGVWFMYAQGSKTAPPNPAIPPSAIALPNTTPPSPPPPKLSNAPEEVFLPNPSKELPKVELSTENKPADSAPISAGDSVRKVLANFPLNEIKRLVSTALSGMTSSNMPVVDAAITSLGSLPKPSKGDRVAARRANKDGLAEIERGSFSAAVLPLVTAAVADPSDTEVVNNLAYALYKSQGALTAEARDAILCSIALSPTRSAAWANLGEVMAQSGDENNAVSAFQIAFKYSKNQQKTREYLSELILKGADPQVSSAASKALSSLERVDTEGK